jgi:hypothetical protein
MAILNKKVFPTKLNFNICLEALVSSYNYCTIVTQKISCYYVRL